MGYVIRTIKGTGCMNIANIEEPTIISHGTIEGQYGKQNPYIFIPVEVLADDSPQLAIAMLDTVANVCFISDSLRTRMKLSPFAEDHVGNARDIVKSGVYRIGLRFGDIKLKDIVTMEFSNSEFLGADIIIGMNVIALGEFHVSKEGVFKLEI